MQVITMVKQDYFRLQGKLKFQDKIYQVTIKKKTVKIMF